jgi:hypothetical protein
MLPLYVIANVKHYPCKKVKYEREAHRKERCVDKEKTDF